MPSDETKISQTKSNGAPTSAVSASEPQSDDQTENPALDFLYHDVRRIASFVAQIETYGILKSVTATEGVERSTATRTAMTAGASIPAIAKGEAVLDQTTTEKEQDTAARTYDPFWQNGLQLYRYLDSEGRIHRGIDGARTGQFVLVEGEVFIRPATLMLGAFGAENIRQGVINNQVLKALDLIPKPEGAAAKGAPARVLSDLRRQTRENARRTAAATLDLITTLPFTLQLMIETGKERVWCNVADEFLSITGNDLTLTYGASSLGPWQAFGVFDAAPTPIGEDETGEPDVWDSERMMRNLARAARRIAGRPEDAYAMTALLIFRKIMV